MGTRWKSCWACPTAGCTSSAASHCAKGLGKQGWGLGAVREPRRKGEGSRTAYPRLAAGQRALEALQDGNRRGVDLPQHREADRHQVTQEHERDEPLRPV